MKKNETGGHGDAPAAGGGQTAFSRVRKRLKTLYHGTSRGAIRFQLATLIVDLLIIGFFIATPVLRDGPYFLWLDYSVAGLLFFDIVARTLAASDPRARFRKLTVWVDIVILITLLVPDWLVNLGFLRILRLWSLSRSGILWHPLRRRGFGEWRDAAHATVSLVAFLFVMTSFIYTSFANRGYGIDSYIDALYFTVATVTTTGYGDVTLPGDWGKLTSIFAMIIGISLFFRLAQAVFRPTKVTFPCPNCALQRHDLDAVHCKACGYPLKIPDDSD